MARYTDEELEKIKANTSLLGLAESQGYALKKESKDYVMCCPFHDDKTPSLKITPAKNLFHCFGCGAGGSVIDWVIKTQGVSFRHAVELLKDRSSLVASVADEKTKAVKLATVRKLVSPLSKNADQQTALQQVIGFYHQTLKENSEVQDYLKQRGLDSVKLIDHFKLGYANRTLGLHLPHKNRKAGKQMRELLQETGLLRTSGHEHFNGSLVIPVINDNKVMEVYGRKLLGGRLRKGTPQHLYLPGEHLGVFNKESLIGDEVILCESLIDALTFWRWDFKQVTCSYGTNGFTNEILQCFIERKIKRVLIAYDRDTAGNEASEKLVKQLNKNNIEAYRILFPKNTDANEYAMQVQPAQKSLSLAIRKAEPIGKVIHQINSPLVADVAERELETKASPVPKLPKSDSLLEITEHEINLTLGDRHYRIKGFEPENPNACTDSLKINLMVKKGENFHLDKLDLYLSKQRQVFINQASVECGVEPAVIKTDLGKILLQLEGLQSQKAEELPQEKSLSNTERENALSLLKSKNLSKRILEDFNKIGVVGEETNKLIGYLACVSRKLDKPLALMVQSSSSAGKSALMDAILNLIPEDERVQYSAMTGQSLFYMGETNLKNKILAISEEEGAQNASYALKLLQSEGEVTIASTGKDDTSGDLVTKEYRVEGPVMLFMTTTAIDIDEELLNRCLVLTVNESREQTQAIHQAQRKSRTLEGLQSKLEKQQLTKLHRDAQQLLKSLAVINPYADQLTFLDDKTRTRRDHEKYLTLIDSIALLHQYQRETKTITSPEAEPIEYIEVEPSDIKLANKLAHEILGRSLDELPPQTRKLLKEIQQMVKANCKAQSIAQKDYRFSRKTIRDMSQWSDGQLKIHCKRLEELEYLLVHRGGRGIIIEYELLYTGNTETDKAQMMGLLDVKNLKNQDYDEQKLGQTKQKTASSKGQVSTKSDKQKPAKAIPSMAHRGAGQAIP
ncbi:MAG: CHC2 zinc finger domain-containing protein, partial [Cocleimonas sp.]